MAIEMILNASYVSKTTQNQLIQSCGEVKESMFFSVIAVQAAVCLNNEQMSLVLHFVDRDYQGLNLQLFCWKLRGTSIWITIIVVVMVMVEQEQ